MYGSRRLVVGAHYGSRDWLSQRVTAVLMALFTLALVVQLLLPGEMGYYKWAGIFAAQWMKVLTFVVIVALALAIEAILDFVGERSGKYRLIVSEVHSHDDYGTSRDLFAGFFAVIMRTLQDVLGPDWTSEMDRAWRDLLREIDSVVTAA